MHAYIHPYIRRYIQTEGTPGLASFFWGAGQFADRFFEKAWGPASVKKKTNDWRGGFNGSRGLFMSQKRNMTFFRRFVVFFLLNIFFPGFVVR